MALKLISRHLILVTPQLAQARLNDNAHNRTMNEERITELCKKIEAGEWNEKGNPIEVTDTGHLINGQHRLTAIIQTSTAVKMRVVCYKKF